MALFGKKSNDKADSKNNKDFTKIKQKGKVFATTVQEILDFDGITEDGIIISKDHYSKLYRLVDANFVTEPEDKQYDILINYTKFLNKFPDNVDISIVIINKKKTKQQLTGAYHLELTGDEYDFYRQDYNKIIDTKIAEGHNDIAKEKYIMLTVKQRSISAA